MPSCNEWKGEWMSLHELARLLDKSYTNLHWMYRQGLDCEGIRIWKIGGKLWARVDQNTINSLNSK